ncbi:MAG: hypothetical protein JXR26_04880 [Balneolaceae bacterium]|nr:hypothetical protein [Balneolaceae bacterium]
MQLFLETKLYIAVFYPRKITGNRSSEKENWSIQEVGDENKKDDECYITAL